MTVLPEIESRFDVLAKLGEGGMGCVYKVRHRDLDEVQIVKTLQAHLSGNEELRNRFINEARRGMRLRHPHIAGVHDFQICSDGTGFIVMEYVHGLNLRDMLNMRGPLPLATVGEIAVQTLDALAYLHDEKFVHRDISPDNLMLATMPDGRPFVKLIDLGISKSLEAGPMNKTATGLFLGKVLYASPEQFGGDLDGRSDLYSFGIVLYKLLTNADPFTGENHFQIMAAHLQLPPRPFEEAAPGVHVPEAVQQVIFRALEKDRDKRYANAAEFRAAVQEAFDLDDIRPITVATRPAITRLDTTLVTTPPLAPATMAATTMVDVAPHPGAFPAPGERVPKAGKGRLLLPIVAAVVVLLAVAGYLMWQRMQTAQLAAYGKFRAVVIGESDYRKWERLEMAANDARDVAQVLKTKYGYDVTLLENATSRQILDALRASRKQLTRQDNLLVYYAGHGALLEDKGYWKPVDADFDMTNWISPALIRDVLLDHPARRTLIIADSCYSGALARGTLPATTEAGRREKRARIVISSGGNAPVIDSGDGKHSLFTGALLAVLNDPPRKPLDVQQLFERVRERVIDSARRTGREQQPELAVMADVGDEGGSFFFVAKR
ncbi:MAG TPA: caspase family protein [Thermoanaerobaculia bacterium]|jgi:tRNA A-37 threonylcarbamoyl transferase component Bud32|nr:caspase family protein [Thermoanaerobaculia bacterium]